MVPPPIPGETIVDSRKRMVEQEIQSVIKQLKKNMSSLKETIANIDISTGSGSNFLESQSLIQ